MLSFLQNIEKFQIKNVTLQVRKIPPSVFRLLKICKKRVLPSIFFQAGLTIEAAISFSLLIFFISILFAPVKIMNQQRKIQAALERSCEELSQFGHFYDQNNQNSMGILERNRALIYVYQSVQSKIEGQWCENISLNRSRVLEDGEVLDLIIDYQVKLPISFFGIASINQVCRSYRRIWIGDRSLTEIGEREESKKTIVFIGKNGTKYHRSRTCHYLFNNLKAVSWGSIPSYRNQSGGIYKRCSRCGTQDSDWVFIMPQGGHYHSTAQCSAIQAYVQEIELLKVVHWGGCSYCSKE